MAKRRYSKRNRYKFKRITFKLTYKQMDKVSRCAELKYMTTNKLIKTAIKEYIDRHSGMLEEDSHVAENQLSLFDKDAFKSQMTIFDAIEASKKH